MNEQFNNEQPSKVMTRPAWRKIAMAIASPVLLLVLVETGLRLGGYGYDPGVVVPCDLAGARGYTCNPKFGWRFFPPRIARSFPPFAFLKDKPPSTYRIFITGSSAAMGDPEPAYSFWRMMEVMLNDRYPATRFEVIPTAMVAINSHVANEIVRECVNYNPDLFVVYTGNNEVIGPYGAGTVFAPLSSNRAFIRLCIRLKATRIGQLLVKLQESRQSETAVWSGLEMFLDKPVCATDSHLFSVYRNFRSNLESICASVLGSKSELILCTVGSNLRDNAPFGSRHTPTLSGDRLATWNDSYMKGRQLAGTGRMDEALTNFMAADALDNTYAELPFSIGSALRQKGDPSQAIEKYIAARDLDVLRFRADSTLNQAIRDVASAAANRGIHLVDAEPEFNRETPGNIAGSEIFLDHVHMTFKGNYILARAVCRQLDDILPDHIRNTDLPRRELLTEAACSERLAYTDWDRYEILRHVLETGVKRPPFTLQLDHATRLQQQEVAIRQLLATLTPQHMEDIHLQYQSAVARYPEDTHLRLKLANLLSQGLNRPDGAIEHYRLALEKFPDDPDICGRLGEALGRTGDLTSGITACLRALKTAPFKVYPRYNLGLFYLLQKRYDEAIEQLSIAVACEPYFEKARNNLGVALSMKGRPDAAIASYRKGIQLIPDSEELRLNLAVLLSQQGKKEEAIKEVQAVLATNPSSPQATRLLQRLQSL